MYFIEIINTHGTFKVVQEHPALKFHAVLDIKIAQKIFGVLPEIVFVIQHIVVDAADDFRIQREAVISLRQDQMLSEELF